LPYLVDPFRSFYCPVSTCTDGIVNAIYTEHPLDGFFLAPDLLTSSEPDRDVEENEEEDLDEKSSTPPKVSFKCSSCDWHSSTAEEWKQFVDAEENFCRNSSETLSEYLLWRAEYLIPSSEPAPAERERSEAALGRIHPLHYLVFWLEDNLTSLTLEDLMQSCDLTTLNSEEIDERLQSLQGTLSVLQEMITHLNSFPDQIVPTNLHEKVIYWDRIGQTAIALADHLTQCIAMALPRQLFTSDVLQRYELDRLTTLQIASKAFQEAYRVSTLSSGQDSRGTKELKLLAGLI
jgi:hypothetical protein